MRILRLAREGLRALGSHKQRTALMMLGTIVGIAALVVIMAIGEGTRAIVQDRVGKWGTEIIKINAGGGKGYTRPQDSVTTLRLDDAEAIRADLKGWHTVSPVAEKRSVPMKAGGRECQADIFAVEPEYHDFMKWPAAQGEGIAAEDVATMGRVCVLGSALAQTLFGDENPIGGDVQIGAGRFRVKGILKTRGTGPGGTDSDMRALIPLTTGLRRAFNQEHVSYIRVKMNNPDDIPAAAAQIRRLIHERHHITPPKEDDFSVVTATDVADAARGISGTLTWLLGILAALSLIVGGIVLMNVQLISVNERTKEIGLRRAVGARRGDIFAQFLTEALVVSLAGMLVGMALGWLAAMMAPRFTEIPIALSWQPFAMAVGLALLVGVLSGALPARRAARLHPVQALR